MSAIQEKRRRTTALLLALPLIGGGTARAAPTAGAIEQAVDGPATAFMAYPHAVGLSVGVIHAGLNRSFHFGTVDKARRQVANDRTIYPIASLTKTFTGLLLAQAQQAGKLRLDDDMRMYLADDYPNLAFQQQPIRLHHLVNHVSGLPRFLPDSPEAAPDFPGPVPFADRLRALAAGQTRAGFYAALHAVKLTAVPRTRFSYSNAAAQLAGDILARVEGVPFEMLVRERIAGPLGMADTMIKPTPEQAARFVSGYEEDVRQAYFPDTMQAAGALKSTLSDMLAYARWQLAERDPAMRLSHQPLDQAGDYVAGLNWQIVTAGTRRVIFQDGSQPGFACLLVLHPDSGMAIVLLSNEIDRSAMARLRTLANRIGQTLDAQTLAVPS